LRKSEEIFRSIFENSSAAMAIIEPDTTITLVNEEYCKLIGATKQEVIGTSWTRQIPPEDLERLKEYNRRRLINPKDAPEKYEFTFYHNSGEIRHALMSVALLSNRKTIASFIDITHRMNAENKVKQLSDRFSLAARAGGVGVWDYDIINNVLLWDDRMYELYGIQNKDFIGVYEAWKNGVHPDDKERGDREIQMAIQGEKEFDTEFRVSWPDGSVHNIRALAVVQRDDSGKALRMIGTNWDITKHKLAEETLHESNRILRDSQSVAHIGAYVTNLTATDFESNAWKASPEIYKIFGIDESYPHTLAGWAGFIHPDSREELLAYHYQVVLERKRFDKEYKIIRINDGAERWVQGTGELEYDDQLKPVRILGTIQDITERKQAALALKESETRFQSIINVSPVPMALNDEQQCITFLNPAFIQTFGYSIEDIPTLAHWWLNAYPDLEYRQWVADTWQASIEHVTRTGEAFTPLEVTVRCKNGTSKTVLASASLVSNSFDDDHLVILYDITERKQIESELRKLSSGLEEALVKAEAGNRLKTAFMNNISHEIRTPLNGILGFSGLIVQTDITDIEKEQFYDHIVTSSHRLLNTVNSFMDISMIASGTMEVKRKPIDLHQILYQLRNQFQTMCAVKNIGLHLEIPGNAKNITLHSDEELLQKILSHILDNAVKFTYQGGITFGYTLHPGSCEFYVKDTGIGIGYESRSLVFESFIQEELSSTRGHEGSGLGLSIAQGLVQLLGGKMHVESEKGHGSTFFFTIPHEGMKEALVLPVSEKTAVPVLNKPVILIAADDESNRFYLKKILTKVSVMVLSATDGKEAMEQCHAHPEISLVLMDLKMPVMDGFEATREIKSFRKDLPIIALTAFAMNGDKKRALEAGCDDYLSKPVSREVFLDKLKKYGVKV
jgi:PAS domain S-box-containing protein